MNKLVKSHFQKGKAGFAVVTLFIVIAVFLLTTGVSILIKTDSVYQDKIEEINSPDAAFLLTSMHLPNETVRYSDVFLSELKKLDYLKTVNAEDAAAFRGDDVWLRMQKMSAQSALFYNKDAGFSTNPVFTKLADGEGIGLYMSQHSFMKGDAQAGDVGSLEIGGKIYKTYIEGSFESFVYLWYGMGALFVNGADFKMLRELEATRADAQKMNTLRIEMQFDTPGTLSESRLLKDLYELTPVIRKIYSEANGFPEGLVGTDNYSLNYNMLSGSIQGTKPFVLLISVLMVVFSLIMTLIALIIINFIMRSGIEDDVKNVGILKALGYTTKQLRQSYVITYGILLVAGAILGTLVAIFTSPLFDKMLMLVSSLKMKVPTNPLAAIGAVLLTVGVASLAVWLATKKLSGVTPLNAMRGGIQTHSFKKNRLPLEKSKLGINASIGLKSVATAPRQSVMVCVIVLLMSFICVFATVLYYNCNVDRTAMVTMSGREDFDIAYSVTAKDGETLTAEQVTALYDKIKAMPEVKKMVPGIRSGESAWINDDISIFLVSADDYSAFETNSAYRGRNPERWDEVAVSGDIAKAYNIKIGDVIKIFTNNKDDENSTEFEFTVVGYTQRLGATRFANITLEAYEKLRGKEYSAESALFFTQYVYCNEGADINKVAATLREAAYAIGINGYTSDGKMMLEADVFNVISPATEILVAIILTMTVIVVAAVVFMIIRMKMIREKKNVSIMKSMGYTGFQIMHQFGLSMLLVALPSAIVGGLLAGLTTNPLIAAVGGSFGLFQVFFRVPWAIAAGITLGVGAINYIVAVLVALGTRFITPRSLITQ